MTFVKIVAQTGTAIFVPCFYLYQRNILIQSGLSQSLRLLYFFNEICVSALWILIWIDFQPVVYDIYAIKQMFGCLFIVQTIN